MAWTEKVILLVDDDEMIYKNISRSLRDTNVKIIWAEDGQVAVDICQTDQVIDLIIMDIQMPRLNGFEATRKIRMTRRDTPIVGHTSFVDPDNIANSIKAGMTDFAIKPIEMDKIKAIMTQRAVA